MTEPLEEVYFKWLCAKVLERNGRNYRRLLHILHSTEFVAVVPADKHRISDGIELRQDFYRETLENRDPLWEELPCSVLEVLIAFAQRAEFQTGKSVRDWFWEMCANLQLDQFRQVNRDDFPLIEEILDTFIHRDYDRKGYGGLFPIPVTKNDQRRIEIWYQFCEYELYHNPL